MSRTFVVTLLNHCSPCLGPDLPIALQASVFSSSASSEDDLTHHYFQQQRSTPHSSPALPRRSPHTPHTDRGRQLSPESDSTQSSTSSDRVDFSTPASTLPRQQHSYNEDGGGGHVARTILALSALNNSKTMDNQIVEIVAKVVGGQGLPWPKPAALKRLSTYEKTRVLILRHLEESLGVRTSNDVVLATNAQIAQVGVSRAVYRGVLDLLKLLLHCVEEDFLKEPEGPLYSVFLIFRIAFSVYFEPKTKSSVSFSLRSALSIGTSLLATDASREPLSPEESPTQVTENQTVSGTFRTQPQADSNGPSKQNGHLDSQGSETSSIKSLSSLSLTPKLASKQNRMSSILGSSHDDLMSQLVNSPRFYHPREGQDVKGFNFLYKELLKGQGSSRPFLVKKEFWSNVFMSTIDADRGYLGWNERTADLYSRYNTLPEVHRRTFGSEEDHLLSIIAHNLLVYMLMVGISPRNTMMLINDFTARTRLATFEEKLLQHTIRYVENNTSDNIDLSYLGLMALYSEIHPTISHIVHYGINMIAPVYKLQITDEALILRRFPDERISARLWNDRITLIEQNESRATVSVRYNDTHGEFAHHFHTKQYQKVYESLKALVHSSNSSNTVQSLQQT